MRPYWQSSCGNYTIYRGDCRGVLPSLPSASFDTVVADIPYGVVSRGSNGLRSLDKGLADTETFPAEWAARESARLAKSVYLWCGTEQVSGIRSALVESGMSTRLGIWEKSNPSPMNGQRLWLSSVECCGFGRHPKAYFARHCKSPVWRGPAARSKIHPTQKPTWLMQEQIEASTPPLGRVLDFCMGSGTTMVAAIELGVECIGVEMDEAFCESAARRIEMAMEKKK